MAKFEQIYFLIIKIIIFSPEIVALDKQLPQQFGVKHHQLLVLFVVLMLEFELGQERFAKRLVVAFPFCNIKEKCLKIIVNILAVIM